MSRPNIDINATVKKLQASCEEKIMKLDQLHQAIAQKEAQLKGISNQSKENLILSELINESASLQLQLANLMVQIEEENEISQQNAQVIEKWQSDKKENMASISYLLRYLETESDQLQRYHSSFQDAYRYRKETNLMMKEDYLSMWRDKVEGIPPSTHEKCLFQQLRQELQQLEQENLKKTEELFKIRAQEQSMNSRKQPRYK